MKTQPQLDVKIAKFLERKSHQHPDIFIDRV